MPVRTVVVCEARIPFVTGGAEFHARALVTQLRRHGYRAELAGIPFGNVAKEALLAHAAAWRLIDLRRSNDQPIDLVVTTKFPTYFVRHPNKVAWLLHQHRAAYELCGTPYSDFRHTDRDVGVRRSLLELDARMLGECRRVFAIARAPAERLERFNGLRAEVLYHPPPLAGRLRPGPYGDYVLSVGRLEAIKRVALLVGAMAYVDPPVRLLIAGDGSQRAELEALAAARGVQDRVDFLGRVDDEQLPELYAGALAVAYAPYDEDYGYVTLEAFLARKPVITAVDSGGPLEFVEDGTNGAVCEAADEALGAAVNALAADRGRAAVLGAAGFERARRITWDGVVEQLVGT